MEIYYGEPIKKGVFSSSSSIRKIKVIWIHLTCESRLCRWNDSIFHFLEFISYFCPLFWIQIRQIFAQPSQKLISTINIRKWQIWPLVSGWRPNQDQTSNYCTIWNRIATTKNKSNKRKFGNIDTIQVILRTMNERQQEIIARCIS